MDEEARRLVDVAHQRAVKILSENKENLSKIAQLLLQKEVIHSEDMPKILGPRKSATPTKPLFELNQPTPEENPKPIPNNTENNPQPN